MNQQLQSLENSFSSLFLQVHGKWDAHEGNGASGICCVVNGADVYLVSGNIALAVLLRFLSQIFSCLSILLGPYTNLEQLCTLVREMSWCSWSGTFDCLWKPQTKLMLWQQGSWSSTMKLHLVHFRRPRDHKESTWCRGVDAKELNMTTHAANIWISITSEVVKDKQTIDRRG